MAMDLWGAVHLYISHIFPQSKKDDAEELLHWYEKKAMHGSNLIGHASPKMDLQQDVKWYKSRTRFPHISSDFLLYKIF